ncbi:aminotransferase in exopolysaccharide biosynthesis [Roseivirga ehrenbergii]|uniref:Aminotransferase DegT n=1 Tax=Roseivirga ehrenbergii (strain DSM 102268 / JCM 13514 / KCTC 12282 / NCIMB 14502 / KMM 6017) TaxID=279360 RepID=A0A150XBY6_ROSEK|nr:LegC family aminotransferase [Roseivirga ehrenbergii]KYG76259.1 aminotransferase DegT [Roseivirga ehrenbergii]TCL00213.1 aminotransferase in exopolysaccharide biosynthesis [Roseivirga ehrenbergii]
MLDLDNLVIFIKSMYGNPERVYLHEPNFWGNEKRYLNEAIDSTFVSSVGKYVDQVEDKIAEITGTGRATVVVNGTAALQVSMRICGVGLNDEVITQALTFVATANAIAYNGARPVFIDVDRDTMGMSPESLKYFLKNCCDKTDKGIFNRVSGCRVAACLPMHTFGFMCRIDEIVDICEEWGIPVIEDAAESFGSTYKGKAAGSFGKMGCISFNGNKIITSGGGGAIISTDPEYAQRAKYLTTTAKVPHLWEYYHDELGYNFRMPNINAAVLAAQLENLDVFIAKKRAIFARYEEELPKLGFKLKSIPEDTDWNYWLISVECENLKDRNHLLRSTNQGGIMTRPIWKLMYQLPMFKDCYRDDQANAEYLSDRIVNLPSSAHRGIE